MIHILALVTALFISGAAAYFSIIGLTLLFSGQFWSIVIMGGSLEVGKLVATSWLYRNWQYTKWLLRTYLICAIIALMGITSLGVYGYLSRAHLEHSLTISTGAADQIKIVASKIASEEERIKDLDKQIAVIDDSLNKLISTNNPRDALRLSEEQRKKNRDPLTKAREEKMVVIANLRAEKIKYETEIKKSEAEVGPLKYVADLIYGEANTQEIERSVRWVIVTIVIVFDPLAVMLLIAANSGMQRRKEEKRLASNKIEIDLDSVMKVK